jgi:ankyrin repeat protein
VAIVILLFNAGANTETRDSEGWTALDWAAIGGPSNVVQAILSQYPAKGFGGEGIERALILSAGAGNVENLQLLLHHGAEIDFKDASGSTALMWAVPEGHECVVSLLLNKGANAKTKDTYRNTLLH